MDNPIRRILRLWGLYCYLDLQWIARNPSTVLTWYTADLLTNLASITGTLLLAEQFAGLGPWSQPQVVFMLGYALLVNGLLGLFCGYNILHISRRIGRGQLDHVLVQPHPLWITLLTEGFTPFAGVIGLVPGTALLVWSASVLGLPGTGGLGWYGWLALNLSASFAVYIAFSFIWGSLAFWAPRAAEEISSSAVDLLGALRAFPLDGLAGLAQVALLSAAPAGLIAWAPCRFLLGHTPELSAGLLTPGAALALSCIAAFIFQKGMRHYGHTGSQRYSPLGHRG